MRATTLLGIAVVVITPSVLTTSDFFAAHAAPAVTPIAPASCDEWATQSTPKGSVGQKCKNLGGSNWCISRANGTHAGTYSIGLNQLNVANVNVPVTVNFDVEHFGSGDAIIYTFGNVDWGDNAQQEVKPFGQNIALTHTYTTKGLTTIRAMFGAQFKYQAGALSGSYEACVDNSVNVKVIGP
jgi:hypothetical protein